MPKNKGFTLIELMVVISIIAILSAIGMITYASFLKNARDQRRQSDLKFIQSGLEEYYGDNLYYPSVVTPGSSLTSGTKTYLTKVPSDPMPNPDYSYVALPLNCTSTSCTSYCLYAQMEAVTLTSDSGCTIPPGGFSAPKAYGVTRP